jgi:hypothetical protein
VGEDYYFPWGEEEFAHKNFWLRGIKPAGAKPKGDEKKMKKILLTTLCTRLRFKNCLIPVETKKYST